jgi:phosphoglucomutase
MAIFYDKHTSLPVGESDGIPLSGKLPDTDEVARAFAPLILSASGWRKVFAVSGDEEDFSSDIGDANRVLAAHMANVFADYLFDRASDATHTTGKTTPSLVLGLDSRPTGVDIADVMCRVFLARGIEVRYLFIAAAPEIMAYARGADAFAYVSASHNPVGHNGVKFGLSDGGVLPGSEANKLIAAFKAACTAPDAAKKAQELIAQCPTENVAAVFARIAEEKKRALETYDAFTREVISGESDKKSQDSFFGTLKAAAEQRAKAGAPVSIVADFNGSARAASIDRAFFESANISLSGMNEKPRAIAHRIVPEGESLSYCAREIERLRREGKTNAERNAILGYVPDCDGDRGNIVVWNEAKKRAEPLEAQEVFALSVIAELAHLVYQGKIRIMMGNDGKTTSQPATAVAVNDPTSLRIEAIAAAFGARVARAEVGEANVVNLARSLREKGSIVRILGEGSNGGNITHPAAVRDPINTVFALVKMLVLRDSGGKPGLFHIWCALSGQEDRYRDDFTLADIMTTLPAFVTTSVFEKDAMLHITTTDHAELKRKFQIVFAAGWEKRKAELGAKYGFASWIAISNNGTAQTDGITDFGVSGKGGLKIQFLDASGIPAGFIWMRGSGTEPVFRILADVRGSDVSAERDLLGWLTGMVLEADRKIL